MGDSNTNVIVMVRNPFSIIRSWIKAPYDLQQCVRGTLDQPCLMSCGGIPANYTQFYSTNLGCPWNFHGLIDVYNTYLRGYFEELPKVGFKSVTIVPYENLVLDTDSEYQRVAEA